MSEQEIEAKLAEYNRHVGKLVRLTNSHDRRNLATGERVHPSQVFVAGGFEYYYHSRDFRVSVLNQPLTWWYFGVGSWQCEVFEHGTLT